MMAKRENVRGAGRKPQGEFSQLTSPFSLRMPEELRKQLEAAAGKSGRSVSQELLIRLKSSFARERDTKRDPAIRALCFLIGEIAHQVAFPVFYREAKTKKPIFSWRSDPFFYRAFKLAVGHILDALAPKGDIIPPEVRAIDPPSEISSLFEQSFKSPENRGFEVSLDILKMLISAHESPPVRGNELKRLERMGIPSFLHEFFLDQLYGMSDAARDLSIQEILTRANNVSPQANVENR